MAGQSSYSFYPKKAFAGMLADIGLKRMAGYLNPNVALYIGCLAVRDAADGEAKHPVAASDISTLNKILGVVAHAHNYESNVGDGLAPHYNVNQAVNVLRQGTIWVQPEQVVTPNDPVYVRFANGIADVTKIQKGSFRKDPDGTAQITTLTPTANVNDGFMVSILDRFGNEVASVAYESGASTTAAAIVTGLKLALGTVPGITLSGSSTLVLTSAVAGAGFSVNVSANLAAVATQPNVQSAELLPNAKWLNSSASNDGFAQLEVLY
jgi:hypothetical protein